MPKEIKTIFFDEVRDFTFTPNGDIDIPNCGCCPRWYGQQPTWKVGAQVTITAGGGMGGSLWHTTIVKEEESFKNPTSITETMAAKFVDSLKSELEEEKFLRNHDWSGATTLINPKYVVKIVGGKIAQHRVVAKDYSTGCQEITRVQWFIPIDKNPGFKTLDN